MYPELFFGSSHRIQSRILRIQKHGRSNLVFCGSSHRIPSRIFRMPVIASNLVFCGSSHRIQSRDLCTGSSHRYPMHCIFRIPVIASNLVLLRIQSSHPISYFSDPVIASNLVFCLDPVHRMPISYFSDQQLIASPSSSFCASGTMLYCALSATLIFIFDWHCLAFL